MSVPSTEFLNVQVIARASIDPLSGLTNYDVSFVPPAVRARSRDAVVNYQLIWPSTPGMQFVSMTVEPAGQDQFSAASVALDGQVMTFSDANTRALVLEVSILFADPDGVQFLVDPQVINRPPAPR
ncbi:MAG: hypothetical protein V4508_05100 [Pseudomonadota bacterium]